jgi:rhamnose transport system ATP-binding protein
VATVSAALVGVEPRSPAVLQAKGLLKEYDGTKALCWAADSVFEAAAGEIHAVVGENGAGKSTLMSILAGLVAPSAGTLLLGGGGYAPGSVSDSRLLGVEIVLQEPGLIGALTVTENFFLGRRSVDSRLGLVRRRRGTQQVRATLAAIAPHVSANALASSLNLEDQKLVELARAVHFSPKVLLIDEMSACLGRSALRQLFEVLRQQSANGVAVLYISHYLDEVSELCDRVTVLRDGRVIATMPTADVDERRLTSLMVGREIATSLYREDDVDVCSDDVLLAVEGLALDGTYRDISFSVNRGEILGIGGLVGCGSDQLARTLFGAVRPSTGTMRLGGTPFRPRTPRQAIDRGVAYVPPDRDREGLLLRAPISTNMTLAILSRLATLGVYSARREPKIVARLIRELSIRCRSEKDMPLKLSGGNRQKVVLAKWLLTQSTLFILHNPTRGIDVGAKAEVYRLMVQLAGRGAAIILISDELQELIGMSDRILMMRRGEISHESARGLAPTEDELITYMV